MTLKIQALETTNYMIQNLPSAVLAIVKIFVEKNFEVYLVGGSVRNMLLGTQVKDWDFTTNATPEEMLEMLPDAFYDNSFGTVGIPVEIEDKQSVVEITTFRTERGYKDARHPSEVSWGKTIEEDLQRRDFTINAIALKLEIKQGVTRLGDPTKLPANDQVSEENFGGEERQDPDYTLIDPFNGQTDLKNHIIRAVGEPQERFKEDALRLMRAVRFATQLSFTIEEHTWKAMQDDAELLPLISGERIRDELLKILASDYPYEGIMMLKNAGLLQYILPELLEGIGVSQARPGRHHVYDVFEHNVFSLKLCPSTDPIVRFAALIHDAGKPRVESKDENGLVIFYNHEITGAQLAYEICNRLRFSKKDRQKVVTLIRWHMFTVDEHITDSAVRRFIRRIGVENVKDMIDVRIGDRLGSGIPDERAESWRLKKFKERIEEQLAPAPFSINDLAINGNDIMKELGIRPGPVVGKLLQQLFEEVDEDLSLNTREYLLSRLHEIKNNQ